MPASAAVLDGRDVGTSVLGVERSLCGKRWLLRPVDERMAAAIAQTLDAPSLIGRLLAARGIDAEAAADFCGPTLRRLLPDPDSLADMAVAAERIIAAVARREPIVVFGDYDVDGATASAVLVRFFRGLGIEAGVYIPDRIKEGYGPNTRALRELAAAGTRLVITVDCGTSAHEPLAEAATAGLDVIVVDHHEAARTPPRARAIVNPNRHDDTSGHGHLAAVGVAFLLAVAVNRRLRERGYFTGRSEPDLRQLLDLVALGTVCDMVPLRGVNRAFVIQGLKVMAQRRNAGLRALADLVDLHQPPGAFELGFMFGPRINAGGRVGEAAMGSRLLSTDDEAEARALALRLDGFNKERQRIEAGVLDRALDQVEQRYGGRTPPSPLVVAGEDWHPGVIGIVASRLTERFGRPSLVISLTGEQGTGSGRSVPGRDLGAAVNAAVAAGLLIKGGGHPMAAGFSIERARIDELPDFLAARFAAAAAEEAPPFYLDAAVSLVGGLAALAGGVERLVPFGTDNPEPRFVIAAARVASSQPIGNGHLRLTLADPEGARIEAIAFRSRGTPLGDALANHAGAAFHVAGRLQQKTWRGSRRLQLLIDDAAPAYS